MGRPFSVLRALTLVQGHPQAFRKVSTVLKSKRLTDTPRLTFWLVDGAITFILTRFVWHLSNELMFLNFFLSVLFFGPGQAPPLVQTLGSSVDLECGDSASKELMAGVSFTLREMNVVEILLAAKFLTWYWFCCTGG